MHLRVPLYYICIVACILPQMSSVVKSFGENWGLIVRYKIRDTRYKIFVRGRFVYLEVDLLFCQTTSSHSAKYYSFFPHFYPQKSPNFCSLFPCALSNVPNFLFYTKIQENSFDFFEKSDIIGDDKRMSVPRNIAEDCHAQISGDPFPKLS